jgi:regulator of RNase E activity RraB
MRELFSRIEDGEVVNIEAEVDLEDEKELYPWLFSVFVKFGNLDEESENFENFLETKESLIIALEYQNMAKYIGSRVKDEWNEFYFYARSAKNLEVIVTKMLRDSGYKYESSVVKDAKWDFYHKYIYPTELELYNIESDKIIFLLEEEGDVLEIPRDVEHYVSFETATQKERFVQSALTCGFEFKDDISSEEFEHGVALVKVHSVKNEEVRKIVEELYAIIKKEHGYYEGWSTTLATDEN